MKTTGPWLVFRTLLVSAVLPYGTGMAGDVMYDFDTDPSGILGVNGNGSNTAPWRISGGNPGGFLALTYPIPRSYSAFLFPDIDGGAAVTAFTFEADLRVGNSSGDRPADGFSVNFARNYDPVLTGSLATPVSFAGGLPEAGTTTGIAVGFDTWSGNTLPDGPDIEGILVRVDNRTVLRAALPVRHGSCTDAHSFQTGPRDPNYWDSAGDPLAPESWTTLCWQKLRIELGTNANLTVTWKGRRILDSFPANFAPSPGRLILAGRTGDANEHTHFDNIHVTTRTGAVDLRPPTPPRNLRIVEAGARRVRLEWDPATDDSGKVTYSVRRDGTRTWQVETAGVEDRDLLPSRTYHYEVLAADPSGNTSTSVPISVQTVAEQSTPGFLLAEVYDAIAGTSVDDLTNDPRFPSAPTFGRYVNGLSFGDPNFSDTFGDNLGVRITGLLTAPESGSFRFFVRSDDASRFYLNTGGAKIPDPANFVPIAQESGCCAGFLEVGDESVSEPVSLVKGSRYGFAFLVKEGVGGDWGQVAWRKEGVVGPPELLRGSFLESLGDPVGARVTITRHPEDISTPAYKSAVFLVEAEAFSPYTEEVLYQWHKNGTPIPGATDPGFSIPVVDPADHGSRYSVQVIVPGSSVVSREATLRVTPSVPPFVTEVQGSDTFTHATVIFDQPVQAVSAGNASNYAFSGGVTVTSATVLDPFTVRLTTSRQTEGSRYTLTVGPVSNRAGLAVVPGSHAILTAWALVRGRVRADVFRGNPGSGQADLMSALAAPRYPGSPDQTLYLTSGLSFGEPQFADTLGDNHLVAIRGILRPSRSGNYRFFVRSDDASRLFVNPSGPEIPEPISDALGIAHEDGCCNTFQEPPNDRTSGVVDLVAGRSYGLLFLVKEGIGGDWGQVAWRALGDETPAAALAPIRDEVYWYGDAPDNGEGLLFAFESVENFQNPDEVAIHSVFGSVIGDVSPGNFRIVRSLQRDSGPSVTAVETINGNQEVRLRLSGPLDPDVQYGLRVAGITTVDGIPLPETELALIHRVQGTNSVTPSVSIRRVDTGTEVSFTGALLSSSTASGPYSPVPGAVSPFRVPPNGSKAREFFRAREGSFALHSRGAPSRGLATSYRHGSTTRNVASSPVPDSRGGLYVRGVNFAVYLNPAYRAARETPGTRPRWFLVDRAIPSSRTCTTTPVTIQIRDTAIALGSELLWVLGCASHRPTPVSDTVLHRAIAPGEFTFSSTTSATAVTPNTGEWYLVRLP